MLRVLAYTLYYCVHYYAIVQLWSWSRIEGFELVKTLETKCNKKEISVNSRSKRLTH